MKKYTNKTFQIEAVQWFKNGDHLDDLSCLLADDNGGTFLSEGKVVRYYRHPDISGLDKCPHCDEIMHNHGWIEISNCTVCPADYIIKSNQGFYYPIKPDIFKAIYTEVAE